MKRSGFSLIEILVVLAVLGILAATMGPSLLGWRDLSIVRGDANKVGSMIEEAKSIVRRDNTSVSFVVDPTNRTIALQKGTSVLKTQQLDASISSIEAQSGYGVGSCGTLTCLVVQAPYGTFQTNPARVTLTFREKQRAVYVIGLTGKVVVR